MRGNRKDCYTRYIFDRIKSQLFIVSSNASWRRKRDASRVSQYKYHMLRAFEIPVKISMDVTTLIESSTEFLLFSWVHPGDRNFSSVNHNISQQSVLNKYIIEVKSTFVQN